MGVKNQRARSLIITMLIDKFVVTYAQRFSSFYNVMLGLSKRYNLFFSIAKLLKQLVAFSMKKIYGRVIKMSSYAFCTIHKSFGMSMIWQATNLPFQTNAAYFKNTSPMIHIEGGMSNFSIDQDTRE